MNLIKLLTLLWLAPSGIFALDQVTPAAPVIPIEEAILLANTAAKSELQDYKGIYCFQIEMTSTNCIGRPDKKVEVWKLHYRIPGNGLDQTALEKKWYNIYGDGQITIFNDRTFEIQKPRILKPTQPGDVPGPVTHADTILPSAHP